jgi:alkanesulfonate monooxygenase SsuD/methylene tetrahydromethanopterin reductase-like flavin-dependent oxidoreductase (luciferase family)
MDVGILLVFQNCMGEQDDAEIVANETRIGLLAEPLGFDKSWSVEHHFTDYAACPDNLQFLSDIAGHSEKIILATGAVIVPSCRAAAAGHG